MSETFAKRVFIASIALLLISISFLYGLAVERSHVWPFETVRSAQGAVSSLVKYGEIVPAGRRVQPPANASREVMTIHRPARVGDGYYVFVGWDNSESSYAAWLFDKQGQRRHRWSIDYLAIDADGPSNGAENPHPFQVLADGSIIVGFDKGDVMARLDACGKPLWVKEGIYHHALSAAEDGSFWAWRGEGTAYGHFNYLENFDAETGEPIRELGLIEDIIKPMESAALVFGVRPDYPFKKLTSDPEDLSAMDLFHPNDVEALGSDLAPLFELFEAGDLLLSFRELNLVTVVDANDGHVKWWNQGPWRGQHDPDFTVDGKISVYNNNTHRGRSEILVIDPVSRDVSNALYDGEVSFKSDFMGKHQYLPNGNLLIVVPAEGRILEVTPDGDNVMEFNNISSNSVEYNEHVENGVWVPSDYFETVPQCVQ